MHSNFESVLFLFGLITLSQCYIIDPGPKVLATKGAVWPKPKFQNSYNDYLSVHPRTLTFTVTNFTCDVLESAFIRYEHIIRKSLPTHNYPQTSDSRIKEFIRSLGTINVALLAPCEQMPHENMDESYDLNIGQDHQQFGSLTAKSIWGILRGLETFSQLLYINPHNNFELLINRTTISDGPLFKYRGLLVDTSRHFLDMPILKDILDGMAYNKLNVFHWHIVDDHSFPYTSIKFPELSARGAYHPTMTYSQQDVKTIIEYGRMRGIRVIPEFDVPAHTRSWGVSHPELLTPCGETFNGTFGPMDPTKETTYTLLDAFFKEIVDVFPDNYLYIGGDEVTYECWDTSVAILEYMAAKNLVSYESLESEFLLKVIEMLNKKNATTMLWHDVYKRGVNLPKSIIINVWSKKHQNLLSQITRDGYRTILSGCWYLDRLKTGGDWEKFYHCDPLNFNGTAEQKILVIGGETCMWGETVDNSNVLQRIFPRASAAAEKLWSAESKDIVNARQRMEEHYCRMRRRDIPAQPPNGPGYCY